MTKPWRITLPCLFLLLSACATPDRQASTPLPGVPPLPQVCSLVPCQLPARPVAVLTEDIDSAVTVTEDALLSCAVQVLDCINKQEAVANATQVQAAVPQANVPGQDDQ